MYAGEYLGAFFRPLWNMLANTNVPGFNVSFLMFFFAVMIIMAVCSFVNRVIDINISTDIRPEFQTVHQRFDKNGELVSSSIIERRRK